MLSYVLIASVLFWTCGADGIDDDEFYNIIKEIFNADIPTEPPKCNYLEGKVKGCYECYNCGDARINPFAKKQKVERVRMTRESCNGTTELCCIAQTGFLLRSGDKCGVSNPEGKARRRRPTLRSVLPGEYPWISWIYKKTSAEPICSATFINDNYKMFITLASCVYKLKAESLTITFEKNFKNQLQINQIVTHKEFDKDRQLNDLALVSVRSLEDAPEWAAPACLPVTRPGHATPCLTHSRDDKAVNMVIPRRSVCGNESLHGSVTCAVTAPGDYAPQKARDVACTSCPRARNQHSR